MSTHLNLPAKLVAIRGPVEQPLHRLVHFLFADPDVFAGHGGQKRGELGSPSLQILCHVVHDLGFSVTFFLCPATQEKTDLCFKVKIIVSEII